MRRLTDEEFRLKVIKAGEGNFIPLEKYKNQRTKVRVRHVCGYEWETLADTLMNKPGCPVCGKNKKKEPSEFKEEVRILTADDYELIGEYRGNKIPISFRHKKCGTEFKTTPKNFILQGTRCPVCLKKKMSERFRKSHSVFSKEVFGLVGEEYEVLSRYQGKDSKVKMKHRTCGLIFEVAPNPFLKKNGSRCPSCKSSKGEKEIEEFLIANSIPYKKQFRIADCRNKRPLPFDFGIFDNDELLMLIEFDGIQHYFPKWGQKEFERTQANDRIKTQFCNERKIPLVRIKYDVKNITHCVAEHIAWQSRAKLFPKGTEGVETR